MANEDERWKKLGVDLTEEERKAAIARPEVTFEGLTEEQINAIRNKQNNINFRYSGVNGRLNGIAFIAGTIENKNRI